MRFVYKGLVGPQRLHIVPHFLRELFGGIVDIRHLHDFLLHPWKGLHITARNSIPEAGWNSGSFDKPTVAAEAILIAEIFDAIEMFEPRAEVLNVSFTRDERKGKLVPSLEVGIHVER